MFTTEKSILINGELEKVYAVAETYPKFVTFYKKKEVLFENREKMVVSISSLFCGIMLNWSGEGIKNKNKSINFTQTQGLLKGLKAIWLFESLTNNTTKVTIMAKINLQLIFVGLLIEGIIGYLLIPRITSRILFSLKCAIECNSKI